MKVPAHSSLIQSIVSLQDVSRAGQPPAARGDRTAHSRQASSQSSDIGVDAGGRSITERAARSNRVNAPDTPLDSSDAATQKQAAPARFSQREVPNVTARNTNTTGQPLGQYINILV